VFVNPLGAPLDPRVLDHSGLVFVAELRDPATAAAALNASVTANKNKPTKGGQDVGRRAGVLPGHVTPASTNFVVRVLGNVPYGKNTDRTVGMTQLSLLTLQYFRISNVFP
jgi:hypothetical protein